MFPVSALFIGIVGLLATVGCTEKGTVLNVVSEPADAEVSVDGYIHPGQSPHLVRLKGGGKFAVKVAKPGYQTVEMMVSVDANTRVEKQIELVPLEKEGEMPASTVVLPAEPSTDPPIESQAESAQVPVADPIVADGQMPQGETFKLNVTTSPAGANIRVRAPGSVSKQDLGTSPLMTSLPRVATEVVVSLAGFKTKKKMIVPPVDGSDVNLSLVLSPKTAGGSFQSTGPIVQPDPVGPVDMGGPRNEQGAGYLSVNTNPWTVVYIDGKQMGNTPLSNVQLATGRHTVLMENRDLGKRKKKVIFLASGQHVRLQENL